MKIATQARSKELTRKVEDVWTFFIPVELEKIQVGKGMFPAVKETTGQVGTREQVGSARTVHMADGSTANEVVTTVTPHTGPAEICGSKTITLQNPPVDVKP